MKDEQKIEFHNKLTASIEARHQYEKVRSEFGGIELGGVEEFVFVLCRNRRNEEEYITDRQKLTEGVKKVKNELARLQYLVDNVEKYYDLGIESYKLWDSLSEEVWESAERETK